MKLAEKHKREARNIVHDLYSMNEPHAIYYFFDRNKKEITCGEFVSVNDIYKHCSYLSDYEFAYIIKTNEFVLVKDLLKGYNNVE